MRSAALCLSHEPNFPADSKVFRREPLVWASLVTLVDGGIFRRSGGVFCGRY